MHLITKSAFARQIGVSPQMVDKIQDRITLVTGKGKKPKVDLHGSATIAYIAEREEKNLQSAPDEQPPEIPDQPQIITNHSGNNPSGLPRIKPTNKRELDEEKIKQQIEKLEIENGMKRGTLIRKDLVIYAFSRLYHIDENQFKALNIRSSPKLSAVVSEENEIKVIEILKFLDRTADKNAKLEILKILNSGQTEREVKFTQIIEDDTGSILLNIQAVFDEFLKKTELEGKA